MSRKTDHRGVIRLMHIQATRRSGLRRICFLLGASSGLVLVAPAHAQLANGDTGTDLGSSRASVAERASPGYDAVGYKIGGFTAFPSATAQIDYDDNILRTSSNEIDDAVLTIRPKLLLRSDWSRHSLTVLARGEIQRFADFTSENNEQVQANATGRIDVASNVRINASAAAGRLIEPRGTSGDIFAFGKPIEYRQLGGALAATGAFGHVTLRLGGRLDAYHYYDARLNGADVSLDYRNYRRLTGNARVSYALSPALALFVDGSANRSRYPNAVAGQFQDRGSHGIAALAGISFDVTSLIRGEVGVGYLKQSFRNPAYPDVNGLDYTLTVYWNPTPLLSLQATAGREVERAPVVGIGAVTETDIRLNAEYELLRRLILSLSLQHVQDRFEGIDRTDRRYSGELGARYLVSQSLSLTAGVSHRKQDSAGALGREYSETLVRAGVSVQR